LVELLKERVNQAPSMGTPRKVSIWETRPTVMAPLVRREAGMNRPTSAAMVAWEMRASTAART